MSRRYWASGPDRLLAGPRHLDLFGGLEVPELSALRAALATIAAAGAHTRVGLTPEPGKRTWSYDAAAKIPIRELPESIVNNGNEAILQHIRGRAGDRKPLEVHVSRRLIALDIDHGLGDGRFTLDLLSSLFALACGYPSPWVTDPDTSLALPRALLCTFGIHPNRVQQAWRVAAEVRSARAARLKRAATGSNLPWSPSFAVAIAHVDPTAEAAVTQWRQGNDDQVGTAALWLYITRQALRAAGLPMAATIKVAFNCRRYLPRERTVNGNFMIGPDVPLGPDETLPAVARRLSRYTSSATPLAGVMAVSAMTLLGFRSKHTASHCRTGDQMATVMHSDMARTASIEDLPWVGNDEPSYTGLLDPATPESITVYNTKIGSARDISISFHDNVFSRQVIDRAAELLSSPVNLLPSSANSRS